MVGGERVPFPKENYSEFSIKILVTNTKKLRVYFTLSAGITSGEVTLEDKSFYLKSESLMLPLLEGDQSLYDPREQRPGFIKVSPDKNSFTAKGIELFFESDLKQIVKVEQTVQTTLTSVTSAFTASSPPAGVKMLQMIQYFNLLRLLNVDNLPPNSQAFLEVFKYNALDLVPNPFSTKELNSIVPEKKIITNSTRVLAFGSIGNEYNQYCKINLKFTSMGVSCLMMNNIGNVLLLASVLILLKGILVGLARACGQPKETSEDVDASEYQDFVSQNKPKPLRNHSPKSFAVAPSKDSSMNFGHGTQDPSHDQDFFHKPNIYAEYDPETGLFGNPQFYATKNEVVE